MKIPIGLVVAAALTTAGPVNGQTRDQDVLAVVTRFFDGMRARDTAVIASTLFGEVTLVTTATDNAGKPVARSEAMTGFMESVAKATGKLDERISSPEVRVEDNLATVWTRYELYVNDKYSHCGIDAFQLVKTDTGWRISAIADTRRASCK